ncbi:MAG: hypothetical protein KHX03_04735 [Clostridium sp.]|nr:hypothetical protein [Clostridium sp.]
MSITAVNFKNNNIDCCKPAKNNAVSFGTKHNSEEKKSHKGILITAGVVVGAAALAFAFKKQIAKNKFVQDSVKKLNETMEPITKKGTEMFDKMSEKTTGMINKAKNALKKSPQFSKKETELLHKYKKTGANQQGVFDILKKHGMNDSEEKYVKETLTLLKEKFAKKKEATKPVSTRLFINLALKKETPEKIIDTLLNNSKNLRKKWSL